MSHLEMFKKVLLDEARAIERICSTISNDQIEKLESLYGMLMSTGGNLVFCGVGKSGVIAQKLASTFSSLSLPSFFLHPTEALHGDLGRVGKNDAIVFISKSGTTEEIIKLLPFIKIPFESRVALVGGLNSPIAKESSLVFDCSIEKEACINDLAPTTSSTVALAVGDAMAVVFEAMIGLSRESFAVNHPGGLLGKSLSLKVEAMMVPFEDCPSLNPDQTLQEAIIKMTQKPIGMCLIVEGQYLRGVLVEGDIRRALSKTEINPLLSPVSKLMNESPVKTNSKELAFQALELMENREHPISVLPVVNEDKVVGVLRLHDLLKAGFLRSK